MKCLLYRWNSYFAEDIIELLNDREISYEFFDWKFTDYENDDAFLEWFDLNIESGYYDFVISINYWPLIAEACHKKSYKYVAWCYDCPINVEHPENTLSLPGNYVYMFDRKQCDTYNNQGIDTVHHLKLGVNLKRVERFQSKYVKDDAKARIKYKSDVSLVGSLYESQLPIITAGLNEATKQVLNEIISVQESLYDKYIIDMCLSSDLIDMMNAQYACIKSQSEGKTIDCEFRVSKAALEFALSSEVTRKNRLVLLNLFGRRYDTKLYSFQTFPKLEGVTQCGVVDYTKELPYVFTNSKINLNPILRCTQTGIPLRAFDIMGYGGFLLSSYQSELNEEFEEGREMVTYRSYEEAVEKTDYYLKHEDERIAISDNGRAKVLSKHTLQQRFDAILNNLIN